MDILSELSQWAEGAEVYTVESEASTVSFEANEIKSAQVEETQGIALRAVVNGRLGFTAASGRILGEELVENLLASAQYGDHVPLAFPPSAPGPQVEVYDPSLADVPVSRFVEIGREIIAALLEADEDAKISVDIERGVSYVTLSNSAGAETHQRASDFGLSIHVERVRGDDVLMVYDMVSDISLTDDYREVVARLTRKMKLAKRPAALASGRMPVLFSPTGAMVLALPIMLATDGENVLRGISPLSNRLGEAIFDPQITLWDDPTLPGRPGSSSHDDEAVPCYRKPLILNGASHAFLYDLKTAALMGAETTGNGARSLFSPPSPSPSNLVMDPGQTPMADLVRGISRGLLVENVLGLGQGNAMSGAFSNTLGLAYAIEGGEIVGRVKDVSIAGNIYQDLREIAALSRESHWVYGHYRMPYILLPQLNVICQQ